jgi:DNA-binding XRE family transcriptional regulator
MRFGEKVRALRKEKSLGQRALADVVGVSFTYISKIENHRLDFGDYPSEEVIKKLAAALDADPTDLLVLAEKSPKRSAAASWSGPTPSVNSPSSMTGHWIAWWTRSTTSGWRRLGRCQGPRPGGGTLDNSLGESEASVYSRSSGAGRGKSRIVTGTYLTLRSCLHVRLPQVFAAPHAR